MLRFTPIGQLTWEPWGPEAEAQAKAARAKTSFLNLTDGQKLYDSFSKDLSCTGACFEPQALSPTFLTNPTVVLAPSVLAPIPDAVISAPTKALHKALSVAAGLRPPAGGTGTRPHQGPRADRPALGPPAATFRAPTPTT